MITRVPFLALLILMPAFARAAPLAVIVAEPNGVRLQAKLYMPKTASAPAIVALHGCAGPLPRRDDGWAVTLAAEGHAVLLPNSFASRGLAPDCKQSTHGASAYGPRRADALAAAAWLRKQPFAPPGGVFLLGWSDGGTTVLAALDNPPAGLLRGTVAFYPACTRTLRNPLWRPAVPLLILIGAADDWTPPAPCQALATRNKNIHITLFPGAYHDFDVPRDPVHLITGLPYTRTGNGAAHAGENPDAAAGAQVALPAFFAALTPGH